MKRNFSAPVRRPTRAALLAITTIALGLLAQSSPASAIVGGELAGPDRRNGQLSSALSLMSKVDNKVKKCGATLLAPNKALTAAHCVVRSGSAETLPARDISVRAGSDSRHSGGVEADVSSVFVHPDFAIGSVNDGGGTGFKHDMAIIFLDRSIPDSVALPARLPAGLVPSGTPVTAAGWGSTAAGTDKPSESLRFVDLEIIDQDECQKQADFKLNDTLLCAGPEKSDEIKGAREGDSGGPLFVNSADGSPPVLAALGSSKLTLEELKPGEPGVYSAVTDQVVKWIEGTRQVEVRENLVAQTLSPFDSSIFMVSLDLDEIIVVDAETLIPDVATIPVGEAPAALVADPKSGLVWVANAGSNDITAIDAKSRKVVGDPIKVGDSPSAIAVDEKHDAVYVISAESDSLTIIDTKSRKVVGDPIKVGDSPSAIAVDEKHDAVYVISAESDSLTIIDTKSRKVVGDPIKVGDSPSAIAVDEKHDAVYIASRYNGSIVLLDSNSRKTIGASINIGEAPSAIAVDEKNGAVYVADANRERLAVVDAKKKEFVRNVDSGDFPSSILIDPQNGSLFVMGGDRSSKLSKIPELKSASTFLEEEMQ